MLNVVASPAFTLSGRGIDASEITPALLQETLQEADGVEANVVTGYHAVEFLLLGQDLNGTGPGAGERPWTDYASGDGCTNGNCDRRADYLSVATGLLVDDLAEMARAWSEDGVARAALMADEGLGISAILTGMGSLSYGELAGERMKLGVMLNDPEKEHDCFSDNTHMSHYYDGIGIRNVYLGSYTRPDGSVVSGASLSDLVAAADPAVDAQLRAELDASVAALGAIRDAATGGMAYDQMLARDNAEGEALILGAVDMLVTQTHPVDRARRGGPRSRRDQRRGVRQLRQPQRRIPVGLRAMIVCHCNAITDRDMRAPVDWMRAADAQTIITPGKVYRALGKRPDCGGCLPTFYGDPDGL